MSSHIVQGAPFQPATIVTETGNSQYTAAGLLIDETYTTPPPPPPPPTGPIEPAQPQFALTAPMPNVVTRFTTISC